MSFNTYIAVNEFGRFLIGNDEVQDIVTGQRLFKNLAIDERGRYTTHIDGQSALVEFFDRPIIALNVSPIHQDRWLLHTHYNYTFEFSLKQLRLDEWDRFIGWTEDNFEFVLSESAQNQFFDQLEEFDDDSITYQGQTYKTPDYFQTKVDVNKNDFWNKIYTAETPRWELNEPSAPLKDILPQLKLPKSRIAVLGCGSGNDAAFLATQGHIVTAIDFSPEAINQAQEKYNDVKNLSFIESDIFELDSKLFDQFDIVYEHTCYVAIDPSRRNELVHIWTKLLHDDGQLLATFVLQNQTSHPPFASQEWEIRRRLEKNFHQLYWTRWKKSIDRRSGKELVVFSKIRS